VSKLFNLLVEIDSSTDEHRFSIWHFRALDIAMLFGGSFFTRLRPHIIYPPRAFFGCHYELPHESLSIRILNVEYTFGLKFWIRRMHKDSAVHICNEDVVFPFKPFAAFLLEFREGGFSFTLG
jgi:hypothetical protein